VIFELCENFLAQAFTSLPKPTSRHPENQSKYDFEA
jgi:hypothetical protein